MTSAPETYAPSRTSIRGAARLGRFGLSLLESLAGPHGVDRYLELVNPMLTVRELRAEVTDVVRATDDTITLTLRPTRQWRGFRAGQHIALTVVVDGVRHTRFFSPASSEHRADGRFELTVKAHPDGLVSKYLRAHARPGLVVGLAQAAGDFTLPTPRPARILLISGGSGITPVMSMLRTLCDEDHRGEIVFLHYARGEADVAYRAELAAITARHRNIRVVYGYPEDATRTGGALTGRFGQQHLEQAAPWHADAATFLCGPAGLMSAVTSLFERNGTANRLRTELFVLPSVAGDPDEICGEVSFDRSGVQIANTGQTLLEQAEAAGLAPEYGCRMGICFTCTKVKTAGCTRNVRSGELHSDPGHEIQLCINVPVGSVALDL